MNKYENGKIYKITSKQTDDVYIGSTTQLLNDRFTRHKFQNKGSSAKLIKYDDCIIELIEDYPCKTKEELLWRERYYFDTIKCININRPVITNDEKKERNRIYAIENKERKEELRKKTYKYDKEKRHNEYENNKESYLKKCKEYYENNKERKRETGKEWYEKNKEYVSDVAKKRYSMKDKKICAIQRQKYRVENIDAVRAWDRKRNLHRYSEFGKLCKMF